MQLRPYILEMKTYRYRGHSMSDPAKYRTKEEVSKIRQENDPIDQLKSFIINNSVAKEEEIKEIDTEIKNTVLDAVEFAKNDKEPDPKELYSDVLQGGLE